MRYLCLVYVDASRVATLTKEDGRLMDENSLAYDRELMGAGHFIHANALQEPDQAVSLKVRSGKVTTTDGPFAETKEHLGGFILIEARDLNEAIAIGAKIPMAEMGTIEIRPIMEF